MPVTFHKRDGQWRTYAFSSQADSFALDPLRFDASGLPRADKSEAACLVRGSDRGPWVLLVSVGRRVLHNGAVIAPGVGIRVLAHMDCLALESGEVIYFSTEEAARVMPFAGPTGVSCPRCRSEIRAGEPAVKCPGCGVFHHEIEDRNCWTYAPTCALCAQPTPLDHPLQWTPEGL